MSKQTAAMSGESGALRDILRRLVRARLTAAVAATSSSSSSTASTMSSSTLSTAVTRESEDLAYGRKNRLSGVDESARRQVRSIQTPQSSLCGSSSVGRRAFVRP